MTEDELRELDACWASGMLLKQISRRMGYTPEHLCYVMRHDRARFPRRIPSFTEDDRAAWADRVLSGELTVRDAAGLAGCDTSTVRKWVRARRAGQ